jgi:hypothetical protein
LMDAGRWQRRAAKRGEFFDGLVQRGSERKVVLIRIEIGRGGGFASKSEELDDGVAMDVPELAVEVLENVEHDQGLLRRDIRERDRNDRAARYGVWFRHGVYFFLAGAFGFCGGVKISKKSFSSSRGIWRSAAAARSSSPMFIMMR